MLKDFDYSWRFWPLLRLFRILRFRALGYIYKIIKDLAKAAGLEDIHPHRGRHTFISNMVENGVDAYLAMELSRQRSLKAYQTYSKKVRYQAAKAAFLKGKNEPERKPLSLEQMLERG